MHTLIKEIDYGTPISTGTKMVTLEIDGQTVTVPEGTSIMRAAIQYRSQVIGIISMHSYGLRAFDQSDLATLKTFADYCGGAIERIRAEDEVANLHRQLLSTARRAGMEEVASSVLHNVGNVLNTTEADLDRIYRVNVKGVANCLRAGVEKMEMPPIEMPSTLGKPGNEAST